MTKAVQVTVHLGGHFIAQYQQICGEIVSEGTTDKGDEYIIFKDGESEKERRLLKKQITKILPLNAYRENTPEQQGG